MTPLLAGAPRTRRAPRGRGGARRVGSGGRRPRTRRSARGRLAAAAAAARRAARTARRGGRWRRRGCGRGHLVQPRERLARRRRVCRELPPRRAHPVAITALGCSRRCSRSDSYGEDQCNDSLIVCATTWYFWIYLVLFVATPAICLVLFFLEMKKLLEPTHPPPVCRCEGRRLPHLLPERGHLVRLHAAQSELHEQGQRARRRNAAKLAHVRRDARLALGHAVRSRLRSTSASRARPRRGPAVARRVGQLLQVDAPLAHAHVPADMFDIHDVSADTTAVWRGVVPRRRRVRRVPARAGAVGSAVRERLPPARARLQAGQPCRGRRGADGAPLFSGSVGDFGAAAARAPRPARPRRASDPPAGRSPAGSVPDGDD